MNGLWMTLYSLQHTLAPERGQPEDLYLRLHNPQRGFQVQVSPPAADGGLDQRLNSGEILSTDTFFGSFYRSYWEEFTALEEIAVTVRLQGQAAIRVFEDTGQGVRILRSEEIGGSGLRSYLLQLPPRPRGQAAPLQQASSRLFVEVEAQGPCRIAAIAFATPAPPQRQATLSIGLCTFNQEAYFARTLEKVAALAQQQEALRAVYVVNQGQPFQSPAIRSLLEAPKVHSIRQRNLGGCGGFTRSLDEALNAGEPASHHLMMDDDIVLDPRMILRALRFLDYAARDIALGAGMLDAMRPSVMYEAGAFLRPENRIEPYCHNVDLADPAQLHHFNKPAGTDYNAWWFCILPLEQCRAAELPAPVFIRGDDFEYGQRLAARGVPTVTLPGIAVWHEPFYAKPSGWQDYYDLRNRLIFGATYAGKVRQLPLAHVLGLITSALLTHNYMAADLRLRAVEDFLAGPDTLFAADPEDTHKAVMALAKANAPQKLDNAEWQMRPLSPGAKPPPPQRMRQLVLAQAASLLRTGLGPHRRRGRPVLMDSDAHVRNTAGQAYVLTNGPRSFHLEFMPDRGKLWRRMLKTLKLALRYRRERDSAGSRWAGQIARYRKAGWWAPVFARQDQEPQAAGTQKKAA